MSEYRLRFAKETSLRFLSHLELIRAMERSLRRAALPMAYSEGFHPHPKLSFGPALAVGVSSSDEYFDVQLTKDFDPEWVKDHLNKAFPDGLRVLEVKKIEHHVKPLNAIINRASYTILIKAAPEDLTAIIQSVLNLPDKPELMVERRNKDGVKTVNIRPWLHNVNAEAIGSDRILIRVCGEIGSGGNLRPDDIIDLIVPSITVLEIHRDGLWHEEKEQITRPLDFCEAEFAPAGDPQSGG